MFACIGDLVKHVNDLAHMGKPRQGSMYNYTHILMQTHTVALMLFQMLNKINFPAMWALSFWCSMSYISSLTQSLQCSCMLVFFSAKNGFTTAPSGDIQYGTHIEVSRMVIFWIYNKKGWCKNLFHIFRCLKAVYSRMWAFYNYKETATKMTLF